MNKTIAMNNSFFILNMFNCEAIRDSQWLSAH